MTNEPTESRAAPQPDPQARVRRRFLKRLAIVAGLLAAYPVVRHGFGPASPKTGAAWRATPPWPTLDAVLQHLFPAGPDAPGAEEIGALDYLHAALGNPLADGKDEPFVSRGAGWLDELARSETGKSFASLDEIARESVLRRVERSPEGARWLSLLLTYLLEALLADPVYGGNPRGVGWTWLEHQPGYPAPSPDKVWWRLGGRPGFRHKAA